MFAGFVAMQATPIGWIADLALIGYSAWMVGSGITELIKTFIALDSDVSRAKCDADLDAAAKRLAKGFVTGGGEVVGGLAGVWGVKSSGGVTRIAEGIRTLIEFGKKNFARTLPPTVVIEGGVGATPPTPPLKAGLGGTVDQAETGVQWGKGIQGQGNPFENWVQAQLKKLFPSVEQTPGNFPTIDHIDRVSKTVWSTKTMDTVGGYKDPKNIYSTLKGYVDKLAEFPKDGKPVTYAGMTVNPSEVATRKLVLGIPAGTSAAQWAELSRAIQYASSQGIELIVTVLKP